MTEEQVGWRVIWKSSEEPQKKEAWLRVFIDKEGKVHNAEFFLRKRTRSGRTYLKSIGIKPAELLKLCEKLDPIHTKLLRQVIDGELRV